MRRLTVISVARIPLTVPGDRLLHNGPFPATKTIIAPGSGFISVAGVTTAGNSNYECIENTTAGGLSDSIDMNLIEPGNDPLGNSIRLKRFNSGGEHLNVFIDTGSGELLYSTELYASVGSITITGNQDGLSSIISPTLAPRPRPRRPIASSIAPSRSTAWTVSPLPAIPASSRRALPTSSAPPETPWPDAL
ncbi:MAG: hypothetical protein EXR98_11305 [Gemmataceae bacterium]|nr:hypothetical protein [Gemmataceae bacterium]